MIIYLENFYRNLANNMVEFFLSFNKIYVVLIEFLNDMTKNSSILRFIVSDLIYSKKFNKNLMNFSQEFLKIDHECDNFEEFKIKVH